MRRSLLLLLAASVLFAAEGLQDALAKALAAHEAGRMEEAVAGYEAVLRQQPNRGEVRSNLGAALVQLGRYEEAITQYQKALKLDPQHPGIRFNLALAHYKAAQMPEAVRELTAVHQKQPGNWNATLLLADCQLRLGENKQVIALLEPAAAQRESDLALTYLLGTALIRDQQIERGQVLIDRILRKGDSAEARLLMGTAKLMIRDYAGALKELEQAITLNPDLPDVYSYYGLALLQTADAPGALAAFRKELARNSNDFESNLNVGALLKQEQNFAEALPYLQRAARVRPGSLAPLYQIAGIELATGHVDAARQMLERIVKESPDFVEGHVMLATTYYRLQRKDDAERERAIVKRIHAERQAKEPGAKE